MADRADLLVEIGTEELPPKSLRTLSEAFGAAICERLEAKILGSSHVHGLSRRRAGSPSW